MRVFYTKRGFSFPLAYVNVKLCCYREGWAGLMTRTYASDQMEAIAKSFKESSGGVELKIL